QGVPAPVPADHDDDDRGTPRYAPDRPRHRGGSRVAARAGAGGRGRPALVSAPDALHHPGAVHLHGVGTEAARHAPRAVPASRGRWAAGAGSGRRRGPVGFIVLLYSRGGRRPPHGCAASNAADAWSTVRSAKRRPTICRPTGRPAGVNPAGTEAAGWPVKLNG